MYEIHNLQRKQLTYLKNAFPEIKNISINNDTLVASLENGSIINVTYDANDNLYYSNVTDDTHGYEGVDSIGDKTIYNAIKGEIEADDNFVDTQTAYLVD